MRRKEALDEYLATLSDDDLQERLAHYQELARIMEKDREAALGFNAKQKLFINALEHEVMLSGGNKGGKTTALLFWFKYLLEGVYPDWYEGVRLNTLERPPQVSICGVMNETIRDNIIERLLGPLHDRGSGILDFEAVTDDREHIVPKRGCYGLVDYALVKWRREGGSYDDEYARVNFWSYGTGWESYQSYNLDAVGIDEESKVEWYAEMMQRVAEKEGYLRVSETPNRGMTPMWLFFHESQVKDRRMIIYGVDDFDHWREEKREWQKSRNEGLLTESAVLWGIPESGVGIVYTVPTVQLWCAPFEIPGHWPRIIGIDVPHTLGDESCFAAVLLAHDQENDVVYVCGEYKAKGKERPIHASRVRAMGGGTIPVAWPDDGGRREEGHGQGTIARAYQNLGLAMLKKPARPLGIDGKPIRSGIRRVAIEEIQERMATGRLKLFRSCHEWREEKEKYRHEDGVPIPKQEDHLMHATDKAIMMLRYARPLAAAGRMAVRSGTSSGSLDYDFFEL